MVADFQIANQEHKTFLKEIKKKILLRHSSTNFYTAENTRSKSLNWILSLANQNETWWKGNVSDTTIYGFNVQFHQHTSDNLSRIHIFHH